MAASKKCIFYRHDISGTQDFGYGNKEILSEQSFPVFAFILYQVDSCRGLETGA
jgi:hypothetical protein